MLCVYRLEEAIALREAGIAMPVLVLGPVPPEGLEDALAAKAELALWSTGEFARRLCKAARNRQCAAAVHVKVNTDLNRLGFEPHELTDAVEEFLRLPELSIAGIFSHLASAEELNAAYTMHQLGTFERALARRQAVARAARDECAARTSRRRRQRCFGRRRASTWRASASRSTD